MQFLLCFFALFLGTYAAPIICPLQNITVTDYWFLNPTKMIANQVCTYSFNFAPDSYAFFKISATGGSGSEYVTMRDDYMDQYSIFFKGDSEESAQMNWPSKFNVDIHTGNNTNMVLEMTVTLRKLPKGETYQVTTKANDQPSLIYFDDFKEGTSYTFTSNSTFQRVVLMAAPSFKYNNVNEMSRLNSVFLYEGNKSTGTLSRALFTSGYISNSNSVTLYSAQKTDLTGAIFVTDYANFEPLANYNVQYAPVNTQDHSTWLATIGTINPSRDGGITVIGDKKGTTPITIRQLSTNEGAQFKYMYGGPLANYDGLASPITNANLPRTLSGSMTTFLVSKGAGNIKISV